MRHSLWLLTLLAPLPMYAEDFSTSLQMDAIRGIDAIFTVSYDRNSEAFTSSERTLKTYGIELSHFPAIKPMHYEVNKLGVCYTKDMLPGFSCNRFVEGEFRSTSRPEEGNVLFGESVNADEVDAMTNFIKLLKHAQWRGFERIWVLNEGSEIELDPRRIETVIHDVELLTDSNWDILFTQPTKESGDISQRIDFEILNPERIKRRYCCDSLWYMGRPQEKNSFVISRQGVNKLLKFYERHGHFLPFEEECLFVPDIHIFSTKKDLLKKKEALLPPPPTPSTPPRGKKRKR